MANAECVNVLNEGKVGRKNSGDKCAFRCAPSQEVNTSELVKNYSRAPSYPES